MLSDRSSISWRVIGFKELIAAAQGRSSGTVRGLLRGWPVEVHPERPETDGERNCEAEAAGLHTLLSKPVYAIHGFDSV